MEVCLGGDGDSEITHNFLQADADYALHLRAGSMSEQETSRTPPKNIITDDNHECLLEESPKTGGDLEENQWSPTLSSPDSGMGNTIFSSPEKSDKENNDSLDSNSKEMMECPNKITSPLKIKLNRNNIYGADRLSVSSPLRLGQSYCNSNNPDGSPLELLDGVSEILSCHVSKSKNETINRELNREPVNPVTACSDNVGDLSCNLQTFRTNLSPTFDSKSVKCLEDTKVSQAKPCMDNKLKEGTLQITKLNQVCLSEDSDLLKEFANSGVLTGENTSNNVDKNLQPESSNLNKVLVSESKISETSLPNDTRGQPCLKHDALPDLSLGTKNNEPSSSVILAKEKCVGKRTNNCDEINSTVLGKKDRESIEVGKKDSNINLPVSAQIAQMITNKLDAKANAEKETRKRASCSEGVSSIENESKNILDVGMTLCTNDKNGENKDGVNKSHGNCDLSDARNELFVGSENAEAKNFLGVDVGIDLDALRDTDSEAGDSCCSEDHEACEGANGCLHQDGVCDTEQNWDYLMDEEFNVPKKPILNGSAEQLERRSSLKRKATEDSEDSSPPKCKRGIQFEGVTVFYFPRSQGFTCVPSQGGSTLGMSRRHAYIRQFSLAEHAVEQRRAHREYLLRLRQQRTARERGDSSSRGSSSEDSEENSEEASDLSDSELDADSYYFLQPLPIRQRRTLLRQAGICHIEGLEKEECKDIRVSRELCGCQCKVYCDPDTCQCAEAGIRCQVDRHNFPCGCSREGCGNTYGRIEFNPIRVRTHFIHTLMRLEIEKRQHQQQQQQHQQQQQQQQWEHQQRAKWLATTSASANGFSGGSGVAAGTLPFFEGAARDATNLAVTDLQKFSTTVEMASCVSTMNPTLYPHFESRQMLGPAATPASYVQQDKTVRFMAPTASTLMAPNKEAMNDYTTSTSEAGVSSCSSAGENAYKLSPAPSAGVLDGNIDTEDSAKLLGELPFTSHSSSLSHDANHLSSSNKSISNQVGDSSESPENLGEIVKKSIVETVSA
ncbi:Cysteine/serine-rich nuclear protein N-terminus [Halocaridina rubra]|uniref:Cysteine/serine-rich nuclear protein N-terminus n=1 Tax=Halocaridina rubra TaxID=373956 RepID=A0AAN8XIR3_HALRR